MSSRSLLGAALATGVTGALALSLQVPAFSTPAPASTAPMTGRPP